MVCADLEAGSFQENIDIAREVADRHPYGSWIKDESRRLEELGDGQFTNEPIMSAADTLKLQVCDLCTASCALACTGSLANRIMFMMWWDCITIYFSAMRFSCSARGA